MNPRIAQLVSQMNRNPGASESSLKEAQARLQILLPADYVAFMSEANGATGFVGNSFLNLMPIEELANRRERLKSDKHTPGLLIFGSDGGGMAYAFDTRSNPMPIVEMDFVTIDVNKAKVRAVSFVEFIEYLHNQP
jgi:SMI1/KNR4 family protein SUKH-1